MNNSSRNSNSNIPKNYYPFGMVMPNRSYSAGTYRFGFNTQEKDDEICGAGNTNTAMFWEYSTRLGQRWNTDPNGDVGVSPYFVFSGNPILRIDVNGDTDGEYFTKSGQHLGSDGKNDGKVYTADKKVGTNFKNPKLIGDGKTFDISDFKRYVGKTFNESSKTNPEEMFGIASAIKNYANFKEIPIANVFKSGTYSFASGSFSFNNNNKSKTAAVAAVINALTGGKDLSNGATHWDGVDFVGKGFKHVKPVNQGIQLSFDHIEQLKSFWTVNNIKSFSGNDYSAFNPDLISGIHKATDSNSGRVLYKSTAVLGGTVFWGPNKDATIYSPPKICDHLGNNPPRIERPNEGYNWKYY